MKRLLAISITLLAVSAGQSAADTVDARCDIYPAGGEQAAQMMPCTFSQRQGYVTISRNDGVVHELSPVGDTPGNFEDRKTDGLFSDRAALATRA